jgi:hypothetical protein
MLPLCNLQIRLVLRTLHVDVFDPHVISSFLQPQAKIGKFRESNFTCQEVKILVMCKAHHMEKGMRLPILLLAHTSRSKPQWRQASSMLSA